MVEARREESVVVLTVCNNGSPVAPAAASRVFEPFFSTRPGRAGLGLPIVRRWLAAMQGTIELVPAGNGFEIRLPQGGISQCRG